MNITQQIEMLRLGYGVTIKEDLAYHKLKCLGKDVHVFFDGEDIYCPLFTARFCNIPNRHNLLALANEDGRLVIHNVNKDNYNLSNINAAQAHLNAIFDFAWSNFEMKILTASGDHTCILWDIGESSIKPLICFQGHNRSVKTIAQPPDNRCIFATGGRDGVIMCWDTRYADSEHHLSPDIVIKYPHIKIPSVAEKGDSFAIKKSRRNTSYKLGKTNPDSVTGLVFQDSFHLISCSAGDGTIKVWDIRKTYTQYKRLPQPKHEMLHPGNSARIGFTNLVVSPCGLKLYVNCVDNSIYCYNIGTYNEKPVQTYHGHSVGSYYIKHTVSPCGRYIASGSSDDKAYIWSVKKSNYPLVSLQGHSAEVTCIDWSSGGELKLATCSDDASYRIWKVHPEKDFDSDCGTGFKGVAVACSENENPPSKCSKRPFHQMSHFRDEVTEPNDENNYSNFQDIGHYLSSPEVSNRKRKRILNPNGPLTSSPSSETVLPMLMDLPNYVIDGTCPHNYCIQRPRTSESVPDWLTKLRQTTSPSNLTPRSVGARRRKSSTRTSSPRGNLLNFFKISSRQQQYCSTGSSSSSSGSTNSNDISSSVDPVSQSPVS